MITGNLIKFYLFVSHGVSRCLTVSHGVKTTGECGQWTGYYNVDSWSPPRSDRSRCTQDWGSSQCRSQPEIFHSHYFSHQSEAVNKPDLSRVEHSTTTLERKILRYWGNGPRWFFMA